MSAHIEGRFVCPNCELHWIGVRHRVPYRDNDVAVCKCGELLHEWNGSEMWTFILVSGPRAGFNEPYNIDGIPF